ncbi:HET-domain-containing protein [Diaporthe eres]|nr:HET-domain-containing protein [Diaporthe eres]
MFFSRTPLDLDHDPYGATDETLVPYCLEIGFRGGGDPRINVHRKDRVSYNEFDRSGILSAIFSLTSIWRYEGLHWQDGHFDQRKGYSPPVQQIRSMQPQIRVIDVDAACIVPLPPAAAYAALSYQWGMDQRLKLKVENKKLLYTPGYLSSPQGQPSRTIVDAMSATSRPHYCYLWVDALCVIQDSPEDKKLNLGIMDQIYHNAEITVVAAAGQDAEHGLPGVSTARTERQIMATIKGLTVSNMLEAAAGAISFSRWNTRGWTYQERLLSRRLLTFTETQVYYHCDHRCNFHEQFHTESVQPEMLDTRACLDFEESDIWEMYAIGVAEYSGRSITDPSDKLPAFTGMTNFLVRPYGAPFFFGLPAPLFDMGLLWRAAVQCERGESTQPSWSWSGWTGSVVYMAAESMNNMCECTSKHLALPPTAMDLGAVILTMSARGYHTGGQTQATKVSSTHGHSPFPNIDASALAEALEANSATLRIHRNYKQGNHVLCHLAILDGLGRRAGTVQVSGDLVPRLKDRSHRFLALSRSTLYRIDEDPSWDDDSHTFCHWTRQSVADLEAGFDDEEPNFDFFDRKDFDSRVWWPAINVLLLSEPGESGAVERIGIGKIHVTAFEAVCEEDEILLG